MRMISAQLGISHAPFTDERQDYVGERNTHSAASDPRRGKG